MSGERERERERSDGQALRSDGVEIGVDSLFGLSTRKIYISLSLSIEDLRSIDLRL